MLIQGLHRLAQPMDNPSKTFGLVVGCIEQNQCRCAFFKKRVGRLNKTPDGEKYSNGRIEAAGQAICALTPG